MLPPLSLPRLGRPKSQRLIARLSVRLRREGGSLTMTIPVHIVRHWKLQPGARLILRSTDEGMLLYPRYFLPYREPDDRDDRERGDSRADEAAPAASAAAAAPATAAVTPQGS